MGPTIEQVDAKQRLHRLVDELTDAEATDTLEYAVRRRGRSETPGDVADEWGNLDDMLEAAAADLLCRLDKEEIEEHGETIAESFARAEAEQEGKR